MELISSSLGIHIYWRFSFGVDFILVFGRWGNFNFLNHATKQIITQQPPKTKTNQTKNTGKFVWCFEKCPKCTKCKGYNSFHISTSIHHVGQQFSVNTHRTHGLVRFTSQLASNQFLCGLCWNVHLQCTGFHFSQLDGLDDICNNRFSICLLMLHQVYGISEQNGVALSHSIQHHVTAPCWNYAR